MKKANKTNKLKDYATKVHARAMADMPTTTLRKVTILEDQATMVLFTMLKDQLVTKKTC
jgi:hypothetical protein